MHELGLMEEIAAAVTSAARGARVHRVRLVVGRRTSVSPSALRRCFAICTSGSVLEGAVLAVDETDGDELRLEEMEVS